MFRQTLNFVTGSMIFSAVFASIAQAKDIHESLRKEVYIYQQQSMKEVNWLYIGYVPRMEDPHRVRVVLSKASFTMRVSMEMTKQEIADYPAYLYRRATELESIIKHKGISVYQWWRYSQYQDYIHGVAQSYDLFPNYSEEKFKKGLGLLKKLFPTNVFEKPLTAGAPANEIAVVANFVYPITINRSGKGWPRDGVYIQADSFASHHSVVQERRTDHGKYVNGQRIITDYIFSGFPAFWIDPIGKATGIHGPIRYSEVDQREKSQAGPYGPEPENMKRFWSENEFREEEDLRRDLNPQLRWDVVRTNNSAGCFRAETMELRHLLPTSREKIFRSVQWEVISQPDRFYDPASSEWKWVDINYYVVNPYSFPLTRDQWYERHKDELVPNYLENSYQFEYLDPATVEFRLPGNFSEAGSNRAMTELNQAGGEVYY